MRFIFFLWRKCKKRWCKDVGFEREEKVKFNKIDGVDGLELIVVDGEDEGKKIVMLNEWKGVRESG